MKKLLIMLMVVAMAAFLFVGCIPGVTTVVDDEDEEEPVVPTTVAPIITSVSDIDITSSATQYVNKAEAADGIVVTGTAPTYSEVRVYINGLTAGTGDAGANGVFEVVVAPADLEKAVKTDGPKILHATAKETGLAESASSNECPFTLDTALPTITKCSATAGSNETIADVDEVSGSDTAGLFSDWNVDNPLLLVEGMWKIEIIGIVDVQSNGSADSGDLVTIEVTPPSGPPASTYVFTYLNTDTDYTSFIPGVEVEFDNSLSLADVGAEVFCDVTPPAAAVAGYIDVTFDADVTGASILAGPWTAFGATVDLQPTPVVWSATTARLTETLGVFWYWWGWGDATNLISGVAYSVSCSGITDLAGNPISATAPETCTGIVMP